MSTPGVVKLEEGSSIPSRRTTYRIRKELGEGGFGSVYRVEDGSLSYAMKLTKMWTFMPHERLEFAKRFRQEFDYGSRLRSRYLVRSHDFDTLEGNPFLVMDLCEGGNLRDWVGRGIDSPTLDRLAHGILSGLRDLHGEGIIHRDIKPENVLFDEIETPKLADFGISASVKKRHTMANFMGHAKEVFATGTYSPPEQIDPKRAMKVMGPGNDIYAFGAMMYELITRGHLPFGPFEDFLADMEGYEAKKAAERWDSESLQAHAPDPKWVRIIGQCIRQDPEERYRSVDEVLTDLGWDATREAGGPPVRPDSVWRLRVQNGEEIGREYHISNLSRNLARSLLSLGWFNEEDPFANDLGIAEHFTKYISSFHATLEFDSAGGHWVIRDGQFRTKDGRPGWYPSTNGTLVNGRRVGPQGEVLRPNDIIAIGDTTLKVLIENP